MSYFDSNSSGGANRYSAKKMAKPVNFICQAASAQAVHLVGDFNDWQVGIHPMQRAPDGSWQTQVALSHGHHRYHFMVDGSPVLDPRAQGITRNERNERVCLIAVS